MTCPCHAEPAYWTLSTRHVAGGFWRCAVKKRDYQRGRYDRDPIHRIEKNLRNDARKRRNTIERRKAHVNDIGGLENYGSLQKQGRR